LAAVAETPEQKARREIDAKLIASGWLVQDRDDLDLTSGRGIAVREFPMKSGFGFADYDAWLAEHNAAKSFTPEQREWLDRIAEHIATSLEIQPDDFEDGWFGQHGSLGKAHALFGNQFQPLLADLNARLAA
jgi:EcoEI R protein C-terminal